MLCRVIIHRSLIPLGKAPPFGGAPFPRRRLADGNGERVLLLASGHWCGSFRPLHRRSGIRSVRLVLEPLAHRAQPRAHGTAQRTGRAAGQAALQGGHKGLRLQQRLGRFRVPAQYGINGGVCIGLHKGLHRVVHTAGKCSRHRRVIPLECAVPAKAAHPVRDLPRQRVLCIVRAHAPGKVCHTHTVDGPSRAKLCKSGGKRSACALPLLHALSHALCRALRAQHRQHQIRAYARHRKVLRRAAHNAHGSPRRRGHARLRRRRVPLAIVIQLVPKGVLVHAVRHLCPRNTAAHGVDLRLRVSLFQKFCVGVRLHARCRAALLGVGGLAAGQHSQQLLLPCIPPHFFPQRLPVFPGLHLVPDAHPKVLTHQKRRCRHRCRNALCRVRAAPHKHLRRVVGRVLGQILPRLVDLLLAVPHPPQLRVRVLCLRLLLPARAAARAALGIAGVCAAARAHRGRSGTGSLLGVAGVVLLLLPHQIHQLPVPLVRVHPQVPPVKVVPLYGIGCLCPLLRGVVPARIVPVRFVVLLPVGLYRAASGRAQYAVQHIIRQLLAVQRPQLPRAAAHPAGIRAALRQLHPGL